MRPIPERSWDLPDESRPTRWTTSSGDPKTHWNLADDATQGNSGPSHALSRESPSPRLHSIPSFARIRAFGTDYPRPIPTPSTLHAFSHAQPVPGTSRS